MNKYIIGIDPGSAGGIAWTSADGVAECEPMPEGGMAEIFDRLCEIKSSMNSGNVICYLEDVGMGIPGQSSKATATFARHNGHIEMALYALGIRTIKVVPQKWQRKLGFGSSRQKNMNKTEWKNYLKAECKRLFPGSNVTLKTADALLILEYGLREEK